MSKNDGNVWKNCWISGFLRQRRAAKAERRKSSLFWRNLLIRWLSLPHTAWEMYSAPNKERVIDRSTESSSLNPQPSICCYINFQSIVLSRQKVSSDQITLTLIPWRKRREHTKNIQRVQSARHCVKGQQRRDEGNRIKIEPSRLSKQTIIILIKEFLTHKFWKIEFLWKSKVEKTGTSCDPSHTSNAELHFMPTQVNFFLLITAIAAATCHPQTQSLSLKGFCRAFIPFPIVCRKKDREKSQPTANCNILTLLVLVSRWARERNSRRRMKNHFVHLETSPFVLHSACNLRKCVQLLLQLRHQFGVDFTSWSTWELAEQRTKLSSDFYQLLISSRVHGTLNSILFCGNLDDFTTHARNWGKNEKVDWEWCHKKCEWEDDTNEEAERTCMKFMISPSVPVSLTMKFPTLTKVWLFFSGGANGREWRRKKIYIKFNSISSSLYLSSLLLDRQYNAFRFHSLLFFRLRCRRKVHPSGGDGSEKSHFILPPELSF